MIPSGSKPAWIAVPLAAVLGLNLAAQAPQWRRADPLEARESHAMAYDAVRGRTVLFGGNSGSLVADTWEFDGQTWQQARPPISPSPRADHRLVYDAGRGRLVLFGGYGAGYYGDTWEYDGITWTQVQPAASPPPRSRHALAYDASIARVVLFGGYDGSTLQDTWEYDGSTWTQVSPPTSPPARSLHAMAYDVTAGKSVLYGGFSSSFTYLGDTWEYDGVAQTWTPIQPSSSPPGRIKHGLAGDGLGRLTLFGGTSNLGLFADTWQYSGGVWTRVTTATAPLGRSGHAMAFDAANASVLLFGGRGAAAYGDTWTFDGTTWRQVLPASIVPPTRSAHTMVYDSLRNRLVTFGGQRFAGGRWNSLGDTWELGGQGWTQMTTATAPAPRSSYGLAYDSARGRTVLYGGGTIVSGQFTNAFDTWEYDGQNWTQVQTANAPTASLVYSMAYDSRRGRTVLFGGIHSTGPGTWAAHDETWEYDGLDWTQISTPTTPSPRAATALTYDARRGVVVMFGGSLTNETWEYSGATWTQVLTSAAPSARNAAALTYDPARGRVVLYGGAAGSVAGTWRALDDTWEYDGVNWQPVTVAVPPTANSGVGLAYDAARGRIVRYGGGSPANGITNSEVWEYLPNVQASWTGFGTGCPGSAGIPFLAPELGSLPRLGSTFQLSVTNLPPTPGQLYVANGLDLGQIGGLPLPLDLGPMGLIGCRLWVGVEPALSFGQSYPGQTANFGLAIPNNAVLAGTNFGTQVLSIDLNAANGIGAMSNAGIATVY